MKRKIIIIVGFVSLVVFAAYSFIGFESYCWWNPSIDTQFAPKYSEELFLRIKPQMSEDEVVQLIGEPFEKYKTKDNVVIWYYSKDGKSKWGDWAWLNRGVYFDTHNRVVKTASSICYD